MLHSGKSPAYAMEYYFYLDLAFFAESLEPSICNIMPEISVLKSQTGNTKIHILMYIRSLFNLQLEVCLHTSYICHKCPKGMAENKWNKK